MSNLLRWILSAVCAVFIVYAFNTIMRPVHAAPTSGVPQCEKVAETPNLAIYFCEPDNGPPFYINSYGFMVLVD